jgi:hypothetical protein
MVANGSTVLAMPKRFSTARGREFGDGLRAAIANTGMTSRAVAELVGWQEAKVSDLVNGKGGATELEVAILLGVCRTPPEEREHLLALFRETHVKGWWQDHGACTPIRPRTLIEQERGAKKLVSWQVSLVPALIQLPEYARAIFATSANMPEGEIEERVQVRMERQMVLRNGLKCLFYVHESVLLSPIGGPQVLRAQLKHLLKMAARASIEVRIVRFSVGAHAGLAGAFELLTFNKYDPVVFLDSENSSLIIEAPYAVKSYERVLEALDEIALDAEQSKELIKELLT